MDPTNIILSILTTLGWIVLICIGYRQMKNKIKTLEDINKKLKDKLNSFSLIQIITTGESLHIEKTWKGEPNKDNTFTMYGIMKGFSERGDINHMNKGRGSTSQIGLDKSKEYIIEIREIGWNEVS